MFRQKDTLDMHVCKQKIFHKIYICMFRQKDTLDMHEWKQKKYLTKYIYVCLGSKIPWICMYIAKIPHKIYIYIYIYIYMYVQVARYLGYPSIQQKYHTKIYICLGSKISHEKKQKTENNNNNNKLSS